MHTNDDVLLLKRTKIGHVRFETLRMSKHNEHKRSMSMFAYLASVICTK